jgi:hypothetical protein
MGDHLDEFATAGALKLHDILPYCPMRQSQWALLFPSDIGLALSCD